MSDGAQLAIAAPFIALLAIIGARAWAAGTQSNSNTHGRAPQGDLEAGVVAPNTTPEPLGAAE